MKHNIVTVLSVREDDQESFYPEGFFLDDRFEVIVERPSATRTSEEWAQYLIGVKAEVLISGWGTESLVGFQELEGGCPLSYVCNLTGSVRSLVPRPLLESGLLLSNWGGLAADAVAEHALLLVLSSLREVNQWRCKGGVDIETRTLFGKKVLIHGIGSIARKLIEILAPFDVEIKVFSSGVDSSFIEQHGVESVDSLAEAASWCDVFIECEALTPLTKGMVSAGIIQTLPAGSVFVNVARGSLVDEDALLERLRSGDIRAGLDVFQQEPLPSDSLWWELEGALVSPHVAGPTRDQFPKIGEFAIGNLQRYADGKDPLSRISVEIYDRAT